MGTEHRLRERINATVGIEHGGLTSDARRFLEELMVEAAGMVSDLLDQRVADFVADIDEDGDGHTIFVPEREQEN